MKSSNILSFLLALIIVGCMAVLIWTFRVQIAGWVYPEAPVEQMADIASKREAQYGMEMVLMVDRSGHYKLDATVDNTQIDFLIDTGASITVLSYDDADRVGIDVDHIAYDTVVMTGAGQVMFARAMLPYIEAGSLRVDRLQALVAPENTIPQSVLGMNFLKRLHSYSVESGKMTLVP